MPRAFDRHQLNIDRDPLRSIMPELSALPTLEIPDIFAVCNQPFITGMKLLGTGDGEISKIATGLQVVIDTLFGTLFCNAQNGLTPQTMFGSIGDLLEPIIDHPFVQGLVELADWLGRATGTFLGDVFQGLIGLVDWVCGILTCNPNASGTTPQSLIDGFQAVLDPIITNPFIVGIVTWAQEAGVAIGNFALDVYNGILAMVEALCSLITTGALPETYGNWSNTPAQIIADIASLIQILLDNPLVNGLRDLITGTGNLLFDTIAGLSSFISSIFGVFGGGLTPQEIVDFLQNAINAIWELITGGVAGAAKTLQDIVEALTTWISNIPLVGPLVGYLTAGIQGIDFTPDFAGLAQWAERLLHIGSNIPANNLIGEIPEAMLSLIPVANINIQSVNLLGQGAFATADTIAAADGWSWDATVNDPDNATPKGSAKLVTAGAARALYSRQAIKVAAGDKIKLSARVRTASYTGTSTSIVLSVIPYIGTTAQPEVVFATRGASNGAWVTMTGTAADRSPWTVPANVTSVIAKIGVTAASGSGSTVWFDNVDIRKEGLLGQNLVEYLLQAWEGAWTGLVGTSGAGKIWSDLQIAAASLRDFANGTNLNLGTLSGNLLAAPASVLGSIVSVVFDGSATVGTFLRLLFNALTGNNAASATAATVAQGATSVRQTASGADLNATSALGIANGASGAVTTLRTSLIAGYTVVTVTTNNTVWTRPNGLSELYVAAFGGGARGGTSTSAGNARTGGRGGQPGGFVASEIDVAGVPATVTCTIGSGSGTGPSASSFGTLLSSEDAFKAYVATPLGLLPTGGQPTAGGRGGSVNTDGEGIDGLPGGTTTVGLAGGTGGAYGAPNGGSGGIGGTGLNFGLCQTGGAGGGGGGLGQNAFGPARGGTGGAGGFPGGGGGGGGAASGFGETPGVGGLGGNGAILIIYKTANTTS